MYDRILIAVDGSESNRRAVDQGLVMAKASKSGKVTAVCVFDVGNYSAIVRDSNAACRKAMAEESEKALEYVKAQAAKMGVEVECKTLAGHPVETLVRLSPDYDLIVCGTMGKTGLPRVLLGSVAENVVRLSECPVLVCR